MRRLLAGLAAGLALAMAAPAASAQDSQWSGSKETTPDRVASAELEITAMFVRRYNPNLGHSFGARTWVTVPSGLPKGCPAGGETELRTHNRGAGPVADSTLTASDPFAAPCNGVYSFRVSAWVDRGLLGGIDRSPTLTGTVEVAAPAPDVSRVSAAKEGSTGAISWTPLADPPPDFLGYFVERAGPGGEWDPVAKVDASSRAVSDPKPIGSEGAVYRVRTRRAAPGGEVLSRGKNTSIAGDGTTTTVPPGGTDGGTTVPPGTDGGTSVPPGTDGGAGGGGDGGGGGAGGGRVRPQPRGRTGVGTVAPRLGQPSQANFPPLLTPDDGGFEEEIDYGDRQLAGDEGAEGDLTSEFFEEEGGRGMAVPVATGFVLAAWAFHLRFLAKAARPDAEPTPAHGRRRRLEPAALAIAPEPLAYEPVAYEPGAYEPVAYEPPPHDRPPTPAERYEPPAHYRPPTLGERFGAGR